MKVYVAQLNVLLGRPADNFKAIKAAVALAKKAGADMVGPGFENHVRITHIVDGELKTETEKIEEPVNMNQYDIDHWIDAIQNDGEPAVLPEQAATVVRVIEAIYESAKTGQVVYFE